MGIDEIEQKASKLMENLKKIDPCRLQINLIELFSKAGGGALPLLSLPSKCLRIKVDGLSANTLEINMRKNSPPIIGRIQDDAFIIDPRTLQDDDLPFIESAFKHVLKRA
jgi:L-seryl-tRNA(Ser) seleniumtransferase